MRGEIRKGKRVERKREVEREEGERTERGSEREVRERGSESGMAAGQSGRKFYLHNQFVF